mmetsp:Transcript_906/g.1959  ORF Transcript_906/g.1959 Transcript_906/m.1959 type:complete len:813 (-) Transcript_906:1164-3602(-)
MESAVHARAGDVVASFGCCLDLLDDDCLLVMFESLSFLDRLRCSGVCRRWRQLLQPGLDLKVARQCSPDTSIRSPAANGVRSMLALLDQVTTVSLGNVRSTDETLPMTVCDCVAYSPRIQFTNGFARRVEITLSEENATTGFVASLDDGPHNISLLRELCPRVCRVEVCRVADLEVSNLTALFSNLNRSQSPGLNRASLNDGPDVRSQLALLGAPELTVLDLSLAVPTLVSSLQLVGLCSLRRLRLGTFCPRRQVILRCLGPVTEVDLGSSVDLEPSREVTISECDIRRWPTETLQLQTDILLKAVDCDGASCINMELRHLLSLAVVECKAAPWRLLSHATWLPNLRSLRLETSNTLWPGNKTLASFSALIELSLKGFRSVPLSDVSLPQLTTLLVQECSLRDSLLSMERWPCIRRLSFEKVKFCEIYLETATLQEITLEGDDHDEIHVTCFHCPGVAVLRLRNCILDNPVLEQMKESKSIRELNLFQSKFYQPESSLCRIVASFANISNLQTLQLDFLSLLMGDVVINCTTLLEANLVLLNAQSLRFECPRLNKLSMYRCCLEATELCLAGLPCLEYLFVEDLVCNKPFGSPIESVTSLTIDELSWSQIAWELPNLRSLDISSRETEAITLPLIIENSSVRDFSVATQATKISVKCVAMEDIFFSADSARVIIIECPVLRSIQLWASDVKDLQLQVPLEVVSRLYSTIKRLRCLSRLRLECLTGDEHPTNLQHSCVTLESQSLEQLQLHAWAIEASLICGALKRLYCRGIDVVHLYVDDPESLMILSESKSVAVGKSNPRYRIEALKGLIP